MKQKLRTGRKDKLGRHVYKSDGGASYVRILWDGAGPAEYACHMSGCEKREQIKLWRIGSLRNSEGGLYFPLCEDCFTTNYPNLKRY